MSQCLQHSHVCVSIRFDLLECKNSVAFYYDISKKTFFVGMVDIAVNPILAGLYLKETGKRGPWCACRGIKVLDINKQSLYLTKSQAQKTTTPR